MNTILLPINPEHVENILNGSKRYEFRRVKCKRKIDKILIYATHPVKLIVGEVSVLDVIEDSKERVWEATSEFSGISEEFFKEYFIDKQQAVAYKLGNVNAFKEPITLDSLGVKFPPQSFMYVPDSMINTVNSVS